MDKDLYRQRLEHVEDILIPLFRAKHKNWDAQSVIDLLAGVLSLAKKNSWQPESSHGLINNQPFFKYYDYRIGQCIWNLTVTLSPGPWTEQKYKALDFKEWPKPEIPDSLLPTQKVGKGNLSIVSGANSPLEEVKYLTKADRVANRKIWTALFRETMLLNKKPGTEIYEYHPYATYVFRFEKSLFRDRVWQTAVGGIDHLSLCEYILRPLYFRAMYDVRSIVPRRVLSRQVEEAWAENGRYKILPLVNICKTCHYIIKTKTKARKTRDDKDYCSNTCRNTHHNTKRLKAKKS